MGGALAIQSSTNKLASLILIAPAINMGHIATDHFPKGSTQETVDLNTFVLHRDFATGFLDLEYPSKVQAFTKPVQIIHGVLDAAVPIEGSRNLVQMYPHAQLLEIEKSNHLFSSTGFQKRVVETIENHLKQIKK